MESQTTDTPPRRPRVLIVGYACEPGKGSEQGTGWNLAIRLAEKYDVTVVTRCNNQEPIERELASAPCAGIRFIYHDTGRFVLRLKKLRLVSVQVYYTLWLMTLARRMSKSGRHAEFDIVHHMTFNTFEIPPLMLLGAKGKTVWGPIGGGQSAPWGLLEYFGVVGKWKEALRSARVWLSSWNPLCRKVLGEANLVLFANQETENLLIGACRNKTSQMVDVGVDAGKFRVAKKPTGEQASIRLLFAGKFEPRKGAMVVLDVFRKALDEFPGLTCSMVGDGEERPAVMQSARDAGLDGKVHFAGRLTHEEMAAQFAEADIYVFSSMRDTTGAIVLEAMASGLPTVCFDHHGARIMVGDDCGIRVTTESKTDAVEAMAQAVVQLARDPEMRLRMGERARDRVLGNYTWEQKTKVIDQWYQRLLTPSTES